MGNTILLADKSTTIQKIVQLTFADDDFNIQTVSDGQTALEMIPQIRPDLVLADISLPVKNGYEICTALRTDPQLTAFSAMPVILLAGIYETMDEERARSVEEKVKQVQANDFLSKPFDPQLLISKVKQYLSPDTAVHSASSASMFAQEADSGINLFDTETPMEPPDDAEKTMMLPGGPFGSMFAAEPVPYDEESSLEKKPKTSIDVDAVKPLNEPVFGEENFPEVQLGAEPEEEENLFQQSTLKMALPSEEESKFSGREEQEFEYSSGPVVDASAKAEPEGSIPLILPDAEDPFGDVFQEPQVPWTSTVAASEEDSPFGVPEPPPPPAVQETSLPVEKPGIASMQPSILPPVLPTEPETFDDTWPGMSMRSNMTHPVEELFESDAVQISTGDDAEELQEDYPNNTAEQEQETIQQARSVEAVATSSAAITEDLIDRIAERVLNKLSDRVVSEIVWQVVPDLAEKMIRREIEKLHASEE
jgi:CheY-like chemotaxis protein